jgi:hypothetical protein
MGAMFGVADGMAVLGEPRPSVWEHRPSPLLTEANYREDYGTLGETILAASDDELDYAGRILWRLTRILVAQGRDY